METPSEVITFAYDCTPSELQEARAFLGQPAEGERTKHFRLKYRRRKPSFGRGVFGWLLFVAAAILLMIYLKQAGLSQPGRVPAHPATVTPSGSNSWVMLSGITVAIGAAAVGVAAGLVMASQRAQRRRWKGKVQMSIQMEGLVERRPGMVTTHFWEVFRGVEVTDRLLLLRSEATRATVIPKRLFASDAECTRAVGLLRHHTTKAAIPYSEAFPVIER
jgi:hypothetical protein